MKSKDEAVVRSSISLQIDKFLIDKKRDTIIASKSMLIVFHSQNSPFFILQYSSLLQIWFQCSFLSFPLCAVFLNRSSATKIGDCSEN